MSDIPMIWVFRGKDINEMTREELIEAVKVLGAAYNSVIEAHAATREFERLRPSK